MLLFYSAQTFARAPRPTPIRKPRASPCAPASGLCRGCFQTYECAKLGDQLHDAEMAAGAAEAAGDAASAAKFKAEAKQADSRMGFLTPILKARVS